MQAHAINKRIPCVVGIPKTIADESAIPFVKAFYRGLGYGSDAKTAFDLGFNQIHVASLAGKDIPKILGNCTFNELLSSPKSTVGFFQPSWQVIPISQPTLNCAVVKVYFGTDRESTGVDPKGCLTYGSKRGQLSLGFSEVSIPRDHRMGKIERPSVLRFQFRENPEKHLVLLKVEQLEEENFFNDVQNQAAQNNKEALVFVHGYNVRFEEAARRTAQLKYDLGFPGPALFFSWPSKGSLIDYSKDEANIEWSTPHIAEFLQKLAKGMNLDTIHIIGHSMGTRGISRAISSLDQTDERNKIKEIILASPDIDADVFVEQIMPRLVTPQSQITIYSSSKDNALLLSRYIHGDERLGGGQIVYDEYIDFIDATNVKNDFLGHSYFGNNNSVLSDIYYLIVKGLDVSDRFLEKIIPPSDSDSPGIYYRFRR